MLSTNIMIYRISYYWDKENDIDSFSDSVSAHSILGPGL